MSSNKSNVDNRRAGKVEKGSTSYKGAKPTKSISEDFKRSDLDQVEKFADKALAPIDVEFSNHFFDRVLDPRNGKMISAAELVSFFKRLAQKKPTFIDFLKKYREFVTTNKTYDLNIPFVKMANKLVAKTIMRKADFKTPDPKFTFEAYAVSGNKVHKFITGKGVTIKGKKYPEVHYELMGISNADKTVKLKVLAPKELFGQVVMYDFRSIRRGPFLKTDTKLGEVVKDGRVFCDNCDWNWKISDGGNDPYMCHKCGNDNTPSVVEALPKGKWTDVEPTKYSEDLIDLVQTAYKSAPEGSFIRSKADLMGSDWHSIDYDKNPDVDATIFYRKARGSEPWNGLKIQGIGHNGDRPSIDLLLKRLKSLLNKSGVWVEASDALEHVLYKMGVPYVEDEEYARKIFPNSDLKMKGDRGKYTRKIAGGKVIKETIFGKPKLKKG